MAKKKSNSLIGKVFSKVKKRIKKFFKVLKTILSLLIKKHDPKKVGEYIRHGVRDKKRIRKLKLNPPKVLENRILFETGDDFSDNGRALFDYMIEKHYNDKYEIIWLVKDPKPLQEKFQYKNVKFVKSYYPRMNVRTCECYEYAYSSKYIFYVTAVNWMSVIRKNQLLINLWHGCGYKANKGGRKVLFDYCLVPGEVFVKTKMEFFKVPERKLLTLGYPRYDLMLQGSDRAKAYMDSLKKKADAEKVILWMPTYRQSSSKRLNEKTLDDNQFNIPLLVDANTLRKLDAFCNKNKILIIIKRHYLQIPYDFGDNPLTNIIYLENEDLFKNDVQLYEFIHYADAMVSDYSSVAIDYILLDRPLGYTLDDYDAYTASRGWVFENPLEFMPGHHLFTIDDMKTFIKDVRDGKDPYAEARHNVKKLVHKYDSDFCQRVLDTFEL